MSEKVSFECDYNNGVVPEIMQDSFKPIKKRLLDMVWTNTPTVLKKKFDKQWACHKLKSSSSSAERKPMQQ